jgi:predicted HicB family RNase H-like nuclease
MSEHKGERVRLTLRVPLKLYRKLQAARKDASLNDYIVEQLERKNA